MADQILLRGLEVPALIGVHPWEQDTKQKLLVDIDLSFDFGVCTASDALEDTVDYEVLAKATIAFAASRHFQLLESFAVALADLLLEQCLANLKVERLILAVTKPSAVPEAASLSVRLERP